MKSCLFILLKTLLSTIPAVEGLVAILGGAAEGPFSEPGLGHGFQSPQQKQTPSPGLAG